MQIPKGRRHSHTLTKGPLHVTSLTLGCGHALPPCKSPLGYCAGLLHTLLWPKGFSQDLAITRPPPPPWASATLGTGARAHMGPAHLAHTSLQPARALPTFHTQTWPSTFCSPELDMALHKDLHPECYVCGSSIRPSVLIAHGARTRSHLPSQKEKAKAWGLVGKAFYKWRQ